MPSDEAEPYTHWEVCERSIKRIDEAINAAGVPDRQLYMLETMLDTLRRMIQQCELEAGQ